MVGNSTNLRVREEVITAMNTRFVCLLHPVQSASCKSREEEPTLGLYGKVTFHNACQSAVLQDVEDHYLHIRIASRFIQSVAETIDMNPDQLECTPNFGLAIPRLSRLECCFLLS